MFSQTAAITGINIRSIPERWAPSLVIVIGLAGVVAVFTALLAMSTGFASTLQAAGRKDVAIVMRGGSDTELNSGLGREDADIIRQAPGIRVGAARHRVDDAAIRRAWARPPQAAPAWRAVRVAHRKAYGVELSAA